MTKRAVIFKLIQGLVLLLSTVIFGTWCILRFFQHANIIAIILSLVILVINIWIMKGKYWQFND